MTPRIDPRILAAFITVAREGNVSRAAEILFLSQPAVSLQLRRLAQDTGLTLFRRNSKGLELTEDGQKLLYKAQRALNALNDFELTARRMTRSVRGTLRLGTVIDPAFIRLGDLLQRLREAAPDLQTELAQGMSGEVLQRIAKDQIDAGYFLGPIDALPALVGPNAGLGCDDIAQRELTRFNYCIVAPAGWDSVIQGQDWDGLAQLPWIGTPKESVHSRLLSQTLTPLGLTQNVVTLADQESSMLALVRAGVGLSLAREAIALSAHQTHGLVIVPGKLIETGLSFIALKSRLEDARIALAFEALASVW